MKLIHRCNHPASRISHLQFSLTIIYLTVDSVGCWFLFLRKPDPKLDSWMVRWKTRKTTKSFSTSIMESVKFLPVEILLPYIRDMFLITWRRERDLFLCTVTSYLLKNGGSKRDTKYGLLLQFLILFISSSATLIKSSCL